MTNRREFLENAAGAMAGVAFVGCGLMSAAQAQAQPRRREVVVNGRRVKTVDVHAHCAVPEAMALMGIKVNPQTLLMSQTQDRIRAMDEQGIDVEALSINAFWYKANRDLAGPLIKLQNEKLAEICAAQPERFVAFATVAFVGCEPVLTGPTPVLLAPSPDATATAALARRLRSEGWLRPDVAGRVALSLPADRGQQVEAIRQAQRHGATAFALCPQAPPLPPSAALAATFSAATYPYRP